MNPVTDEQPPPLPLQPPSSSFRCHRHPDDDFTSFCPSCLCERLSIVDQSSSSIAPKSLSKESPRSTRIDESGATGVVLETNKELEEEEDDAKKFEGDEVRVSEGVEMSDLENDILEMEAKIDSIVDNLKSMNDHIDLAARSKKPSSNFWTKKWQKWRRKQKNTVVSTTEVVKSPAPKTTTSPYNDTRSEIVDYGLGRRSCDAGPRFSLDAGRVSFDEPRGSWDGRSFPKLTPMAGEEAEPGGSTQTREYYLNSSSSKRKKGLERSNSMVVENPNAVSNSKVSPASVEFNQNQNHRRLRFHSIGGEKELAGDDGSVKKHRWWNWKVKVWGNHSDKNGGEFNRKLSRSNSSVSWRNNQCEGDELVSEKHSGNGLLRFYLTPLRGSKRSGTGTGTGNGTSKIKLSRNMLQKG